jgi:hypothetical protein
MKKFLPVIIIALSLLLGSCVSSKNCKQSNHSCEKKIENKCCKK